MSFLNPMLLLGILGLTLPILAHLLNRYQVKRTDWAAMRFLNRNVRIRSRQLRLRDILLLILRCLAMIFIVLALSRPVTKDPDDILAPLGECRAGLIIALDASCSMQHREGNSSRFDRALERIDTIARDIRPGDPVTLVLLGAEHRVVVQNMVFDSGRFDEILRSQKAVCEMLDLDSVPKHLKKLAGEMKAPQKEIYIVTDMQERDWKDRSAWLYDSFKDLARNTAVFIVPIEGGTENLAITGLELVSGVLRKDTTARYRTTVRNCGETVAQNVRVNGLVNGISADVKIIPSIAPGTSETVSLFISFRDPGPVRITAELGEDALPADNLRRAVAVIRDHVSVLCVEGASESGGGSGSLIAAALRARGNAEGEDDLGVQQVSWVELPAMDLKNFDVVILADVPDITVEQAKVFDNYVRAGNGLIWFAGDYVKANVWNQRSAMDGTPLLPAVIEESVSTSDAMGVGRPLDPVINDHPVCRPLFSLPEDLLSETRFCRVLGVKPSGTSMKVLSLAGSDTPVLLEHSLGRGHVFMFTTSAGTAWNNMAVTPFFPMLLQQMVTYLTAREFETPRLVGDSLSLSYVDQPDASDAVFETPAGDMITVPVRAYRNQYVAVLDNADEAGFYMARVSVQSANMPIAVNVDTGESTVKCLSPSDAAGLVDGTSIRIARSEEDLIDGMGQVRTSRSLWRVFLIGALIFLLVESLLAEWLSRRPADRMYQEQQARTG